MSDFEDIRGYNRKLNLIPKQFADDIGYGLYGGIAQYYIKRVDGTLAQLGYSLPSTEQLPGIIDYAKKRNTKICKNRE